jgi:DNA replicative helicase MCM subunit Mcm2 (Cdc46/Mcm family)
VSDEDVAAIEELGRQGGLFERLAASIAPEIYGMLEVKKVRGCRVRSHLMSKSARSL